MRKQCKATLMSSSERLFFLDSTIQIERLIGPNPQRIAIERQLAAPESRAITSRYLDPGSRLRAAGSGVGIATVPATSHSYFLSISSISKQTIRKKPTLSQISCVPVMNMVSLPGKRESCCKTVPGEPSAPANQRPSPLIHDPQWDMAGHQRNKPAVRQA